MTDVTAFGMMVGPPGVADYENIGRRVRAAGGLWPDGEL
jgi:hypothetical protein